MTAAAAHAAAVPAYHAGMWMPGDGGQWWWMGSVSVDEHGQDATAICVIPGAALLTPTSVRTGTYGSRRETELLAWIMDSYGTSSSDSVAAGARIAMLKVAGRSIPGLKVPAKIAVYARNDLLNAQRYAGKDTAVVVFGGRPAEPSGTPGGVRMDIISATGREIPGIPVRFTATGATITAGGWSGDWKAFTRTGTGPVRVTGTAEVAPDEVTIGTVPDGQTLISAGPADATATASYLASPAAPRVTVECNCDGTGNVIATVSQAAGSDEGRYAMLANGNVAATVTVPAVRHAARAYLTAVNVPDGAVVTFTVSYRVNGRWTAPVRLGSAFTVICPVMPTATCDCAAGGSAHAQVLTLDNTSPFTETVTWDSGGTTGSMTIPAGASKTTVVVLKPGELLDYTGTVRAGGVTATTLTGITGIK